MSTSYIDLAIVDHPGAMQSAVQGLREMFTLANRVCREQGLDTQFRVHRYPSPAGEGPAEDFKARLQIVIIPPMLNSDAYLTPDSQLSDWLLGQHAGGALLCSACAGAFLLADTGLLQGRRATTHWALAERFAARHPDVRLDSNRLLIDDGDILTAGGLMSWVDLGLEVVAKFSSAAVMRQLGKYLVVDTAPREQRYYRSFSPRLDHGDSPILAAQHYLQQHYAEPVKIATLAQLGCLTERTFLRRFIRATDLKPVQYLQRLRIQRACELIESSPLPFEAVAHQVGYEDSGAFRKLFLKVMGLTPREFRQRFGRL
ncbi:GlxA family transcriptional regulator [Marinobacterium arenosum]|uniref:GlxA family transcriptional regulator n=1 Tax=Marinobacterium arenosum TaxID=2862496 RepID=UPI001C93C3AD|nr:helix-turn-helix domain-containing protein [Marinobacterium arenosum]MBY4678959.1 helix-turn-helix domain-containing protein [Marinobacterium arenosum]